ncbi:MAG: flagellar FliJ family protein [Janthinobacterium lividum]
MKKPDSLRILLTVRLRAEEAEERALGLACAEVFQAEALLQSIETERKTTEANGPGQAGDLLMATDFQAREQHLRWLRKAAELAAESLTQKAAARTTQQATYLDARRGREVLDTLLKQRARLRQTEADRRETSRSEDLYLSRLSRVEREGHV